MKILGGGTHPRSANGDCVSKILLCRYTTVQKDVQKIIQSSVMTQISNSTMTVPGFSEGGGTNLLFDIIFVENAWKSVADPGFSRGGA